jgi:hypothetical protein
MVFNVSKKAIIIRSGGVHQRPWAVNVIQPASTTPMLRAQDYQSSSIFDTAIKNY